MAFLEVKNIRKEFKDKFTLDDISFSLEKGEVLSIIGQSGNGKTTLLRCLNYLYTIDDGEVVLNNEVILSKDIQDNNKYNEIRKYRSHIGLVFQQFNLFPQYTAFDNIKLALSLKEKENKKNALPYLSDDEINNEVNTILDKVGLLDKANYYPCELSGGQQQRIAIARAMVLKPDVLCFDEPTSALDPLLANEVLNVIKELKEEFKITMIIVTHELEFAFKISDKVLYLNKGHVASFGSPQEIFENPSNEETKEFIETFRKMRS